MQFTKRHMLLVAALILCTAISVQTATAQQGGAELYFFTSDGCPPCRQIEPMLESLTREGHSITKVDVRAYPLWVQKFNIRTTPTLVMVKNNRELVRHSGLIDHGTVRGWFAKARQFGARAPVNRLVDARTESKAPSASYVSTGANEIPATNSSAPNFPTMHQGTRNPGNEIEKLAMDATVRLRVEDADGYSFATGTVIHCHEGEWLVLTCGHVFRESNGNGVVTAEYGFGDGQIKRASAKLISFDAAAKDVGLVAVKAGYNVRPVTLASVDSAVDPGFNVFSIGCDRGDDPTIRHTQIKSQAKYDGAKKYEIFGRPVVGRSGGGLFDDQGRLVGVCNAAAVDYDEGIYSSLDNIHWQIAKVNLQHLFNGNTALVSNTANDSPGSNVPVELPGWQKDASGLAANVQPERPANPARLIPPAFNKSDLSARPERLASNAPVTRFDNRGVQTPPMRKVDWKQELADDEPLVASDMEVIVVVRSKTNPRRAEAFTLPDPSEELLGYLEKVSSTRPVRRDVNIAELRQTMPAVSAPLQRHYEARAQSPDRR